MIETDANGDGSFLPLSSLIPGEAFFTLSHINGSVEQGSIRFISTNADLSASPNPVDVDDPTTITADFGSAAAGQNVTFSTEFPGRFSPGNVPGSVQVNANSSGVASVDFVPSAGGTALITVDSASSDPQSITLVVNDPNANQNISLSASFDSGNDSNTQYDIQALVTNTSGSPVSGEPVNFSVLSGNASIGDTTDITGPSGTASTILTAFSSGAVSVQADTSEASKILSFQAQVGAGQLAEIFLLRHSIFVRRCTRCRL